MNGAHVYAKLFGASRQIGRLYLLVGEHARGKTFHIYVLPEGVDCPPGHSIHCIADRVEVYGITGGQPGWTECYGWLHAGPWQEHFQRLCEWMEALATSAAIAREEAQKAAQQAEANRIKNLLSTY